MDSQRKQAEAAARELATSPAAMMAMLAFSSPFPSRKDIEQATADITAIIERHMQPQWIPVAERLPNEQEHQRVLAWAGKSLLPYMVIEQSKNRHIDRYTHWMPLPQPPQPSPDAALDELAAQAQRAGEYGQPQTILPEITHPTQVTRRLTHGDRVRLAAKHQPPQRWYDEDSTGLDGGGK